MSRDQHARFRDRIKEMKKVKIDEIDDFEAGNPVNRTALDIELLDNSLRENGYAMPIELRQKKDGRYETIDGHGRIARIRVLWPEVTRLNAIILDVASVAEGRKLLLGLRNTAEWDMVDLDAWVAKGLALGELDLDATMRLSGLTASDLDALADPFASGGSLAPADDAPLEPPNDPVTKAGDVWRLGDHLLWCGDCREDIAHIFGERKATVAITSPPYASQRDYDHTSGFQPIPAERFVEWFAAVQGNVGRHLASDGSWFLNIKPHVDAGARSLYVLDLVAAHVRSWGWQLIDEFCWRNTSNGVPGHWPNRFKNAWEPVFHFAMTPQIKCRHEHVLRPSSDAFSYDPSFGKSTTGSPFIAGPHGETDGLARPSNVIEAVAETRQARHSAPFPLELPSFFIAAFSDPGDLVFEPFCGSGTTLIAAEKLERRCVAIELSPGYCDVIVERWQHLTSKKAERIRHT